MNMDIFLPSLLTGGFAIVGGIGGIVVSSQLARRNEASRLAAEDARRWLGDRRALYAKYLVLVESMLREIDSIGVFLPYWGDEGISDEDKEYIEGALHDYINRWDNELQPALLEVQLMANPEVADLADRASGALMEITTPIELKRSFVEYYPGWFQAKDLVHVLHNSMRMELGLPKFDLTAFPAKNDSEWPWLADRPSRDSYIQNHPRNEESEEGQKE
ncbi:hypothetical protein AAH979_33495 [Plantactinospora sp. ZYX-F-223]|uniref:hypothetical protein n=1 Tax=Plantactinospora sp. ZYX-F-223 TaxID=3144103 RepID=UPI0031FDD8BE